MIKIMENRSNTMYMLANIYNTSGDANSQCGDEPLRNHYHSIASHTQTDRLYIICVILIHAIPFLTNTIHI